MADVRAGAVNFKGTPIGLGGPEVKAGQDAPDFTAVDNGLQPVKLSANKGKVVILAAVPSLDTPVCDTETRKFNEEAGKLGGGVEVWTISMDLPFAQKRWCGAAGVTAVKTLSDFRDRSFAQNYGVLVKEGRSPASPPAPCSSSARTARSSTRSTSRRSRASQLRGRPERRQAGRRRLSGPAAGVARAWQVSAMLDKFTPGR